MIDLFKDKKKWNEYIQYRSTTPLNTGLRVPYARNELSRFPLVRPVAAIAASPTARRILRASSNDSNALERARVRSPLTLAWIRETSLRFTTLYGILKTVSTRDIHTVVSKRDKRILATIIELFIVFVFISPMILRQVDNSRRIGGKR